MNHPYASFDRAIDEQISSWLPVLGAPTCVKGCSNCCRVVAMSSAEGLLLMGYLQSRGPDEQQAFLGRIEQHLRRLVAHFQSMGQTANPLREVWQVGACPLLVEGRCSVYPARPLACRAVHVWHDDVFCGASVGQSRVPAELVHERDRTFWLGMQAETDDGRLPFWGQLSVVMYYLLQNTEHYIAGGHMREVIDEAWVETGLVVFPSKEGLPATRRAIQEMLERTRNEFVKERPWGLMRGSQATRRADLDCSEEEKRMILDERNGNVQPG